MNAFTILTFSLYFGKVGQERRDIMYKNVGRQIKVFANVICLFNIVVGCLFWILAGLSMWGVLYLPFLGRTFYYLRSNASVVGLVVLLGILLSILLGWLSVLFLYAFGEMVDRAKNIDEKIEYNSQY